MRFGGGPLCRSLCPPVQDGLGSPVVTRSPQEQEIRDHSRHSLVRGISRILQSILHSTDIFQVVHFDGGPFASFLSSSVAQWSVVRLERGRPFPAFPGRDIPECYRVFCTVWIFFRGVHFGGGPLCQSLCPPVQNGLGSPVVSRTSVFPGQGISRMLTGILHAWIFFVGGGGRGVRFGGGPLCWSLCPPVQDGLGSPVVTRSPQEQEIRDRSPHSLVRGIPRILQSILHSTDIFQVVHFDGGPLCQYLCPPVQDGLGSPVVRCSPRERETRGSIPAFPGQGNPGS